MEGYEFKVTLSPMATAAAMQALQSENRGASPSQVGEFLASLVDLVLLTDGNVDEAVAIAAIDPEDENYDQRVQELIDGFSGPCE